jgi:CTP:molybdopterin cytidylyltransferase MocA
MNSFKPLLPIDGEPLITKTIKSALSGGAEYVIAVLGYKAEEVAAALPSKTKAVINPDFATSDMFTSIKRGIRELPLEGAFFFLPGDMPFVLPSTFMLLANKAEATGAKVIFPVFEGKRGHPPLITCRCVPTLLAYGGDGGLREALRIFMNETVEAETCDRGCLVDMDTWGEYERETLQRNI